MADRTRSKRQSKTGASTLEFDDFELQSTMQSFLNEGEKESGKGIWNFATIAGMVMLFTGLTFVLQAIGLPVGEFLTDFSTGLISALPLIGGALVTLVGFGFLVGDRKGERKAKRARKKEARKQRTTSTSKSMDDIHGSESSTSYSGLRNDLDSEFRSSSSSSSYDNFNNSNYGYRHAKRLAKSRTDKKISGVCGGLAKYFGISSTVVRIIFAVSFIMYGSSFLIYLGLALAMPKEPVELMDDFDF